ncbi:hypothetical protein [Silvanigrella aquatica]|uniref:Uncharacterized protein n=1 Tax=Silvanigrella aquatica TaxID=1915309 RepID=A0A1L4D038_9BACT|nr:hypothetical protein [Silvanigrella aquatica]APJ03566.1 hypothetical protein AXG55_06450 [Silvanigrella aquatica]
MKNFFHIPVFLFAFFVTKTSFAGSYLFCVDDENNWQWAKPNTDYKFEWAPYYENGFWLNGKLHIVDTEKSLHSALAIDLPPSRNKRASINDIEKNKTFIDEFNSPGKRVCDLLVAACQKSVGQNYKYIGAASHSLAESDWGYVLAGDAICQNWDFKQHKKYTGGYTPEEIILDNVIGIATSGPLPEKGPGISFEKFPGKFNFKPWSSGAKEVAVYSSKKLGKVDLTKISLDDAIVITRENVGTTPKRQSTVKWTDEGYVYNGFTFRGDQRAPEVIFQEGFRLRTQINHVNEVNGFAKGAAHGGGVTALDSGAAGISTSPYYKEDGIGAFYYTAKSKEGHTYFIDARSLKGYDLYSNSYAYEYGVKKPEYKVNPSHKPYEVNYGVDIPADKIVGAFMQDGTFIPNPNYVGK